MLFLPSSSATTYVLRSTYLVPAPRKTMPVDQASHVRSLVFRVYFFISQQLLESQSIFLLAKTACRFAAVSAENLHL